MNNQSPKNGVSLRDQAYQRIRQKMLWGRLSAGSQISEPQLAKLLGMGRTPVREAIQQLQVEGLIQRAGRRGSVVRVPKRMDIVDLYELREGLESYAVKLTASRIGPDDLKLLRSFSEQLSEIAAEMESSGKQALSGHQLQQFLGADMGFHLLLINATGNRHIMKVVSDSHVMSQIFKSTRQEHTLEVANTTAKFHHEILTAVEQSDGQSAGTLMTDHIRLSLREALDHFDRQQAQSRSGENGLDQLPLPQEMLDEMSKSRE